MPPPETAGRVHDAVLWPVSRRDRRGRPLLGAAVPLKVRWDGTRRTARGPTGRPVAVDATAVVDRRVELGALVWQGSSDDLPPGTGWSGEQMELMEVVTYTESQDVRGRPANTYREVGLARYRGALPEADPEA